MSTLDAILLVIVVASAVFGLLRGFVGGIASVAAWLLGGWCAMQLGGPLATVLARGAQPDPLHLLTGYGACFALVALAVMALAWATRRTLNGMGLGGVDRGLGLALGLARGALVACVVVLLLGFTRMPRDTRWQASAFIPIFKPGAQWLAGWLPHWAVSRLDLDGRADPSAALPAPI